MFYRVFGLNEAKVAPAALQQVLRDLGIDTPFQVKGDDLGWTAIEIPMLPDTPALHLEQYRADADDVRDDLDAWAAWLEEQEQEPNRERLMQHVIGTQQLFTLRRPFDSPDDHKILKVCEAIVQFLAKETGGIVQIDTRGFFAADGKCLLAES